MLMASLDQARGPLCALFSQVQARDLLLAASIRSGDQLRKRNYSEQKSHTRKRKGFRTMSTIIDDQLNATGIAQVLVILKSPPPPSAGTASALAAGGLALTAAVNIMPALVGLDSYFTQSELSQSHALAMAEMDNVAAMSLTATSATPARRVKTPPAVLHFPNLGVMLGTVTREGLAGLQADERVDSVLATQQPSLIKPVEVA